MFRPSTYHQVQDKVYIKDPVYAWLPATIIDIRKDAIQVQVDLPYDWNDTTINAVNSRNSNNGSLNKENHHQSNKDWSSNTITVGENGKQIELRWIYLSSYCGCRLPSREECNIDHIDNDRYRYDLADVAPLQEANLLYVIKHRYVRYQKPYTRILGQILLSVNPCVSWPGLYSIDVQQRYAAQIAYASAVIDGKKNAAPYWWGSTVHGSANRCHDFIIDCEPHIYEVSALAYRSVLLYGQNQTILVLGVSGSGKTTHSKLLMQHLLYLPQYRTSDDTYDLSRCQDLANIMIASSVVLEAFGNAKTYCNNNSSRYAKLTQLMFTHVHCGPNQQPEPTSTNMKNGLLIGSSLEACMLESSRVVAYHTGERNFHIFYQILAASPEIKRQLLGLEWEHSTADQFWYLNQHGDAGACCPTSDAKDWEHTMCALESFYSKKESLQDLVRALCVVLAIGNLTFEAEDLLEKAIIAPNCRTKLDLLASYLGVPVSDLEQDVTCRIIDTNNVEVQVPNNVEQATESCDALARIIYATIFASIVEHINVFLTKRSPGVQGLGSIVHACKISLLDMFGFEKLHDNGFEQLCINYANEMMQQKYIQDNLRKFLRMYQEEGIEYFDVQSVDNSKILELFESMDGIINILNNECLSLDKNNERFVSKVKSANKRNSYMIDDSRKRLTYFGVHHFASPVVYNATRFVEANTEKIPIGLVRLAAKSKNPLISRGLSKLVQSVKPNLLCQIDQKKKGNISVLEKFRSQLLRLRSAIAGSQTRYVLCIKPNDSLLPSMVDHSSVLNQLRSEGIEQAIDLCRGLFPNQLDYKTVVNRFECLLAPRDRANIIDINLVDKAQYMISALCAPILEYYQDSAFPMPFACGRTKVFLQSGALEKLEEELKGYLDAKVLVIQKWFRKVMQLARYSKIRATAARLQVWCRLYIARIKSAKAHNDFHRQLDFSAVYDQFTCLLTPSDKYNIKDMTLIDKVEYMMLALASPEMCAQENEDSPLPFVYGTDHVFFRKAVLEILEMRARDCLHSRAVLLQSWHRKERQHAVYKLVLGRVVMCQALWRGSIVRQKFHKSLESLPRQLPFETFVERFTPLLTLNEARTIRLIPVFDSVHFLMTALCCREIGACQHQFACGASNVYLQAGVVEFLDTRILVKRVSAAVLIQCWSRKLVCQLRYQRQSAAVLQLQAFCRGCLCQAKYSVYRMRFTTKLSCKAFVRRFECLLTTNDARNMSALRTWDKVQYMISVLGAPLCSKPSQDSFVKPFFACGATHVYVRDDLLHLLEVQLRELQYAKAAVLQRWSHRVLYQSRYKNELMLLIRVQVFIRGFLSRRVVRRLRKALVHIQARVRRNYILSNYVALKKSTIILQRWTRGVQCRSTLKKEQSSAATLVRVMRRWISNERRRQQVEPLIRLVKNRPSTGSVNSFYDEALCKSLRHELAETQAELERLKQDLVHVTTESEYQRQEMEAEFEEKVNEYEAEVLEMKRSLSSIESDKWAAQTRSEELERRLEALNAQHLEEIATLRKTYDDEVLKSNRRLKDVEVHFASQRVKYDADILHLKDITFRLEKQNEDTMTKNTELVAKVADQERLFNAETLALKETVSQVNREKEMLRQELADGKEKYKANVYQLKQNILPSQDSQKDYLNGFRGSLEGSNEARKSEALRLAEELEKQGMTSRIQFLESELEELRREMTEQMDPHPLGKITAEADRLSKKLEKILAPQHVLAVVNEARKTNSEGSGTVLEYVDKKITFKSRNILQRLEKLWSQNAKFQNCHIPTTIKCEGSRSINGNVLPSKEQRGTSTGKPRSKR